MFTFRQQIFFFGTTGATVNRMQPRLSLVCDDIYKRGSNIPPYLAYSHIILTTGRPVLALQLYIHCASAELTSLESKIINKARIYGFISLVTKTKNLNKLKLSVKSAYLARTVDTTNICKSVKESHLKLYRSTARAPQSPRPSLV